MYKSLEGRIMEEYNIAGVTIYENVKIVGIDNIEWGENIIIDSFTYLYSGKHIKFGNNIHVSSFVFLNGGGGLEIGDFAGFSQGCKVYSSTDDFKDHGFGNPTIPEKYRNPRREPVKIGRFAVIGANAIILPGVTVGEGATVGANTVVSRDLEPWGIYIGNNKFGDRDRDAVLANYQNFLKEMELKE